ncbi:MAG: GIY-YIG nuclease family protein [Patescibacteria group bacterium]
MYYVYILATKYNKMLYVGVTGNLEGRVRQHKRKEVPGFTQKYNITKLVYYEEYQYVLDAIYREKQIKGWLRKKKDMLITNFNPGWNDLSKGWYNDFPLSS